jgi:drug/metabolite transporter (DMT)-like permease
MFLLAIFMAVAGNLLYHVAQKTVPRGVDALWSTLVTYASAFVVTAILAAFWPDRPGLRQGLRDLNWTSFAAGAAIVAIEVGFLLAYRAGWNISLASLTMNVLLAVILVPVGLLLFRERLTASNLLGLALCLAGLVLILRPAR